MMEETEYLDGIRDLCSIADSEGVKAIRLAEEGLRVYPDSTKLLCLLGDLIQILDAGEYQLSDALACYERAAAIDSCCAEAYESIGYFRDVIEGDLQRAEIALRCAVELGGGVDSYVGLARVLVQLGNDKEEVVLFLDGCPHAESSKLQQLKSEIVSGLWSP